MTIMRKSDSALPVLVVGKSEQWGLRSADLLHPPRRFWGDSEPPGPLFEPGVDMRRLQPVPTPAELLQREPDGESWAAASRRAVQRLWSYFLLAEDPQRRLEARAVNTLAHQVSLVQHVLENEHLQRVLIADEVGLGKTIEAGLILGQLLERSPGLRILYLAPARLVSNVRREFDRLGLAFRQWSAGEADARWTDPRILASIHRAVHENHFKKVVNAGPWDVIIVDECHHLSDWTPGGGDPKEKLKLVRDLIAKQPASGRVLFLSGTPHQGHISRFENLLNLLKRPHEPPERLSGRVIYRTKEDVRDWHDRPLFPRRQINPPLVVDLGANYRDWIKAIHEFYRPGKGGEKGQQRAAGWRCAQALQWAASSPQAGLGYLIRQAIRADWDTTHALLLEAANELRPYRGGPLDEPSADVIARMVKEVERQRQGEEDLEDLEEEEAAFKEKRGRQQALEALISQGLQVLRKTGDQKWQTVKEKILDPAGTEKVVLFAQPIETVTALAHFLTRLIGKPPALIRGGQTDGERLREVESFWRPDGPRFLVSSRAGGEGINLQVARRVVHLDVPWNPMDLEQRVGRVHRFGSRQTILVDTLVVKDSREVDAYAVARQKLELIASMFVEKERQDALFARVMALVPPDELLEVITRDPLGPINSEDQEAIGRLVREGFKTWKEFHGRFAEQQKLIKELNPGLAEWDDLAAFLQQVADAKPVEGFQAQRFIEQAGEVAPVEEGTRVLSLGEGKPFVTGDVAGASVVGPDGQAARPLGLNVPEVASVLRRLAFPDRPSGAAFLRWPRESPPPAIPFLWPVGVLVFLRQTVGPEPRGGYSEKGIALHCYVVPADGEPVALEGVCKRQLLRGLFQAAIPRTLPEPAPTLLANLLAWEKQLLETWQRPTSTEWEEGIRHAVLPLFACCLLN